MAEITTLTDFFVSIGIDLDQISSKKAVSDHQNTQNKIVKSDREALEKRKKLEVRHETDHERRRVTAAKRETEREAQGLKNLQSFAIKATGYATKTFATIEASALGVVYAVDKAAKSFERLNYVSQRAGAAPGKIGAFGYAAGQLGSSREEAEGQLQAFGQNLKINGSGYSRALERLGVHTRDANGNLRDSVDLATDLGDALRKIQGRGQYGYANALNQAKIFGFDGDTARAMMNPDFRNRANQFHADKNAIGADPDAAAKSGTAFEQSMRRLNEVLEQIGTKINGILFEKLKPLLDQLTQWFLANGDRIADIVSRIADDLVKLAAAIGEKLAGADWNAILGNVESFAKSLGALTDKLGGEAGLVALLGLLVLRLGKLGALSLPPWVLALLGGAYAAGKMIDYGVDKPAEAAGVDAMKKEMDANPGKYGFRNTSAGKALNWVKRQLGYGSPTGNDALKMRGRNARRGTRAQEPTTPGTYRPSYNLSDADLSDGVLSKIAGEAYANNGESVDAVINNMMNRVGTTAYGPSGNLLEVAQAPGQYAGTRVPSAEEAEFIRSRIRAIASGGVADNTNGSNEYRASYYHGPWYRNHPDAAVVGGNRFAFNPKGGRGPFGPYDKPRTPAAAAPPLADAPLLVPGFVPGKPIGMTGGGYNALGLGADGKPIKLIPPPSMIRGDTNITHNPTYHIAGGDAQQNLAAARLSSSRGQQDLLRNVQGTLA